MVLASALTLGVPGDPRTRVAFQRCALTDILSAPTLSHGMCPLLELTSLDTRAAVPPRALPLRPLLSEV